MTCVLLKGPKNCGDARSILYKSMSYGTTNASLGPRPRRRDIAMDSQHPLGVAHDCLHNNVVPPSRGLRLDIAQPPQGCCLRCLRHRSQTDKYPLRRSWSTNSTVLEAKYIDLSTRPSSAAWIFFGYLYRGTPRGDS